MKVGLATVSLGFGGFILVLPGLANEPGLLRVICYAAALLPFGSFLGFFVLGLSDRQLMLEVLSEAARDSSQPGRHSGGPDGPG
jgi:hypothetical protein